MANKRNRRRKQSSDPSCHPGTRDIPPSQSSSRSLQPSSRLEALCYYKGLPSAPVLVARTGTPWKAPRGPEQYLKIRELRTVGDHPLKEVWEDNLALKVHVLLDSMEVKWTSTDIVRIGNSQEDFAPVILWIGVIPASLSGHDGVVVARNCRELLVENNIADVNVEIRESVVTRSAGPKLLGYVDKRDPTAGIREPMTTSLGLPICAESERSEPWAGGTGGFFISEGGNTETERLLLVTARHAVFAPLDESKNNYFEHKNDSHHRHNVMLFSDASFDKYLRSIQAEISHSEFDIWLYGRGIEVHEGKDSPEANNNREEYQTKLEESRKAVEMLNTFYQDVSTQWSSPESRILGHVIHSPPINVGVGSENYTEDWAIIEVDPSKVDVGNFKGNAIDLGTSIPPGKFRHMMFLDSQDYFNHVQLRPLKRKGTIPGDARSSVSKYDSFDYPKDRLLKLKGTIPGEEMRHPTKVDMKNKPSLKVMKCGSTTGLTIGRANDVFSYTRYYYGDEGETRTSKEWAIIPLDCESGAFSKRGDSGSVIVDGLGRIGGLLNSGAGASDTSFSDITYATPIDFLLTCMHDKGFSTLNLNPVLTAKMQSPD